MIRYQLILYTADDLPYDCSADLIGADWRLGRTDPADLLAPPGTARFRLRNQSRQYSPARAWALPALRPAARLTFSAITASGPIRLFTGQIGAITSDGDPRRPVTVLHAHTIDAQLYDLPPIVPPLTQIRAGAAAAAVLDAAPIRRADHAAYWLLDDDALNTGTRLAASFSAGCDIDTGISRFAWVAAGSARTAAEVLRRIVVSEGGSGYADRFDRLCLRDRHTRLRAAAAVLTLTGDHLLDAEYSFGGVIGRVRVEFTPRRVGPAGTPLWTLEAPLRLDPGTRILTITFRQADRPVVALAVSGVSASATTLPLGSTPAAVYTVLLRADAAGATVEFTNPGTEPIYLAPGTAVLGTPLTEDDPILIERTSPLALGTFGGRTLTLRPPLLDDALSADHLARFVLTESAFPRSDIASITLAADIPGALTTTLGDRLQVELPSVQDGASTWVVGETHTLDPAASPAHRIRFTLIPSGDADTFWALDSAALETASALAC